MMLTQLLTAYAFALATASGCASGPLVVRPSMGVIPYEPHTDVFSTGRFVNTTEKYPAPAAWSTAYNTDSAYSAITSDTTGSTGFGSTTGLDAFFEYTGPETLVVGESTSNKRIRMGNLRKPAINYN